MDHGTQDDLTALLDAARAGGEDAKDRLVRAVYGELRRMAAGFMRRERTDHTRTSGWSRRRPPSRQESGRPAWRYECETWPLTRF